MNRRQFMRITSTLSAVSLMAPCMNYSNTTEKPNFIFILADDLGYGDVNFNLDDTALFKNPHIKTPNLARLAKQSKVFTQHYAASTVCSPSRAGLLTGRTPTRCNINLWIDDHKDDDRMFLSGKETTIPEVIKPAGYESAVIGKWHLNGADWTKKENWTGWTGSFPKQQGFDYAVVTKENPHETTELKYNSQENPGDFYSGDGDPIGEIKGFSSQIITDFAIDWMKNKRDKKAPFFLYMAYDAVHEKVVNPVEYNNMYNTGNTDKDKYYANITYMDAQIGRLLDYLDAHGLSENTVVFFSSDNGPAVLNSYAGNRRSYGTPAPYSGQKQHLFEGGIRVPGMVRWPNQIEPGISFPPNSTLDVLPTICDIAKINLPENVELDGASLLPHLLGEQESIQRSKPLYWQIDGIPKNRIFAVKGVGYDKRYDGTKPMGFPAPIVVTREGHYVLRGFRKPKSTIRFKKPEVFQLYDLIHDPEELVELSQFRPDVFKRMKAEMLEIWESVNQDRIKTASEIKNKINQNI